MLWIHMTALAKSLSISVLFSVVVHYYNKIFSRAAHLTTLWHQATALLIFFKTFNTCRALDIFYCCFYFTVLMCTVTVGSHYPWGIHSRNTHTPLVTISTDTGVHKKPFKGHPRCNWKCLMVASIRCSGMLSLLIRLPRGASSLVLKVF